ncbi:hypothetical protein CLOM_g9682 [Closterium sp. NIES-68]|nr:hypothetical protein CLOM_g9682 [Closterium sp. NIES-68]GJP58530.1 hypothetical protein CLOP_g385 [Closterium sp. NIES-67]
MAAAINASLAAIPAISSASVSLSSSATWQNRVGPSSAFIASGQPLHSSLSSRRIPVGPATNAGACDRRATAVRVVASAVSDKPATAATPGGAGVNKSYNVVVTGSTKGIGLALAREFLKAGDRVVVCSRSGERVDDVVAGLQKEFGKEKVVGTACDVSRGEDVKALAEFAVKSLGSVDVWINNAGSNAYEYTPLVESGDEAIEEIVRTNVLGVMLCCRQAMRLMRDQPGGGHIFNMDGAGADGNATPRFAAYGATKRSLAQFTKSLQAELKMLKVPNVVVHNLSPGMVTTDLLMAGANTPQAKFFINALAEPAEEVAQFLVPRVREVPASGANTSTYIRFLTKPKAFSQIFQRALFGQRKNRYVQED